MENSTRHQSVIGDNPKSKLVFLTDDAYPRVEITYGGSDAARGTEIIDAEEFVGIKGFKAKGKRLTTFKVSKIKQLEPIRFPESEEAEEVETVEPTETETIVEQPAKQAEPEAQAPSEPVAKTEKPKEDNGGEQQLSLQFSDN